MSVSFSPAMAGRIALRELTTTVRRPGWIFSTLLLPLLPLLGVVAQGLLDPERIVGGPEPARVGIVDRAGVLDAGAFETPEALAALMAGEAGAGAGEEAPDPTDAPRPPDRFFLFPDEAAGRAALLGEGDAPPALTVLALLEANYLETGAVRTYRVQDEAGQLKGGAVGLSLRRALRHGLLSGRLPEAVEQRAMEGVAEIEEHFLGPGGEDRPPPALNEELRRFVLPVVAAGLLAMAIFAGAGYLLLGLSEEKENRILELLLANVSPEELLFGKLVGIGSAGLLQFGLWILVMLLPATAVLPYLTIDLWVVAWAVAYFFAGYLLFGALMLGAGTVGDTARHAQQLSGIFTLIAAIPLMGSILILQSPDHFWARALTFFPLTAPLTTIMRLPITDIPVWELCVSFGLLLASGLGAVWMAARLLRSVLWARWSFTAWLGLFRKGGP
ncbi:MAG: ABC transporter permease [Deltaproteobacteria bacterium]|nr:ABC transporter permease [Deltaproteobacteria bacterium]